MAANPRAIPLADLRELRLPLLRTALVRVGLALLLLALLAGAWAIVRDDDPAAGASLIPGGEGGVIVLDLSASIGSTPHLRTANALRYVQQSRQSFGMVLFSDVAYEAVPPGTASTEMASFMRHFGTRAPVPLHPPRLAAVPGRHVPGSGGHSVGRVQPARRGGDAWRQPRQPVVGQLPLGHAHLARARDRATRSCAATGWSGLGVLLISDLDDSLFDVPQLTQTLIRFEREDIPLKIVGLRPSPEDRELFRRVLGDDAFVTRPELQRKRDALVREQRSGGGAGFPLGARRRSAALILLLLALNEHLCGRLDLAPARSARRTPREDGAS